MVDAGATSQAARNPATAGQHQIGFRLTITTFHVGEHALERMIAVLHLTPGVGDIVFQMAHTCPVQQFFCESAGKLFERHAEIDVMLLCEYIYDLSVIARKLHRGENRTQCALEY